MVVATIYLVFLAGQLCRLFLHRMWVGGAWWKYIDEVRLRKAPPDDWRKHAMLPAHLWVARRVNKTSDLPIFIKELEVKANTQLSRLQIMVRTGPMIGLVGTLIPLGPALHGLASSDLAQMGSHMNIAFTMTVFGILIGALAYGFYIAVRNCYERDISELELIFDLINSDSGHGCCLSETTLSPLPIGDVDDAA